MKNIFTLFLLFLIIKPTNSTFASSLNSEFISPTSIDIEMFLMRKGSNVSIVLFSNGVEIPQEIVIERKSNAPLSTYRKVLVVDDKLLKQFIEDKKVLLSDEYPESRQLDSYYRVTYTNKDGVIKILPAVFLSKAAGNDGVTFGDHQEDEKMFEPILKVEPPTYEKFGIDFKVQRVNVKVLLTLGAKNSKLEGEWSIERKSSKHLASFRKVKTIYGEDLEAVFNGQRVFLDKYPESRQLDSYYRLVVTDKEGKRTEFPALFLQGDHAK